MKALHILKVFISLFLMVGAVCPILSVSFFDEGHSVLFAPISVLSAFIGTGLMFGFTNYRTLPKHIGNLDKDGVIPKINQTWMVFFITLAINLFFANLCGY